MPAASDLEERIATALRDRDLQAAATLAIQGYGGQIYGYLRSVLRDEEAAAEAFSQWSEDFWKGIGAFRGEASFRTWAYKLAYAAALRFARSPYRKRGRRLQTSEASRLAASIRSAAASVERKHDAVAKLREELTREEQTLLVLRVDQELSWREVTEVLAAEGTPIDEAAARKRFQRVKDRLRELARAQGILEG